MCKILIIDDLAENLRYFSHLLKHYIKGSSIFTANSGEYGLNLAQKEQPDTILLDINMPGIDGFEVCRRLKTIEETKHIPIILITGMEKDAKKRAKGIDLGADAFLCKPVGNDGTRIASKRYASNKKD